MIRIELLTAPGRGKCQAARALVAALIEKAKGQVPDIQVEEIDVATDPAVAVKYGVMSTPALAINGRLEFTGVHAAQDHMAASRRAARGVMAARSDLP